MLNWKEPLTADKSGLAAPRRGFLCGLVALPLIGGAVTVTDPVFAQIAEHEALLHYCNSMPEGDDDSCFLEASDREEAALQALGDAVPQTTAGAAALLRYMVKVEGDFGDDLSPLMRTMLSVANALSPAGAYV